MMTIAPLPTRPETPSAPPAIREAAEKFEAMVIGQMLQPMFANLETEGLGGGGEGERMFRPMLIDRYAEGLARGGGIGLADAIVRELLKAQEGTSNAAQG